MKKLRINIMLITICLIALPKIGFTQKFAIGPKVGFNATNFTGKDITKESFRKGFQAGAFFAFMPKEWFVLRPEVVYDQRGSQEVIFNNIAREININYLTFPVGLEFRIPINSTFYPKVMVGPYASFALNQKQNIIGNDNGLLFEEADIRRVDVGGFVGPGLDIQSDKIIFTVDLRYLFGSIDVSQKDNVEFRNAQISLNTSLGFRF